MKRLECRTRIGRSGIAAIIGLGVVCCGAVAGGDKKKRPDIYDDTADGATQIAEALKIARHDNKRVLLQFGANWCSWCHILHDVLENDKEIARTLMYEYVLVLIDVDTVDGKKHNEAINERYGNPMSNGLPAWVLLDADGKQLATIPTEPLERGEGYDHAKVHGVLKKYKAAPVSAEAVMSSAIAKARAESKQVFAHFSAPWCTWCKKFDAYFSRDDVVGVFDTAFVRVKIDIERMTGGEDVAEKYGKDEEQGIPFFAVIDGGGKKLMDSVGPEGNCGYPVEDFEVAHYLDVLGKTSKLPTDKLATLKAALALKK